MKRRSHRRRPVQLAARPSAIPVRMTFSGKVWTAYVDPADLIRRNSHNASLRARCR